MTFVEKAKLSSLPKHKCKALPSSTAKALSCGDLLACDIIIIKCRKYYNNYG